MEKNKSSDGGALIFALIVLMVAGFSFPAAIIAIVVAIGVMLGVVLFAAAVALVVTAVMGGSK